MNIVCLVQARMASTRLPGKVMIELKEVPVIGYILRALKKSSLINKIAVVTTTNDEDSVLVSYLEKNNYDYFRGSENDVLDRFVKASEKYKADLIVRMTADCPLIDPQIVDMVIEKAISSNADYTSNIIKRTFPDGYDVEVIKYPILKKIHSVTNDPADREHVTRYILNNLSLFNTVNVESASDLHHPEWRITLDNKHDFLLIQSIFDSFPTNKIIMHQDIIRLFERNPELLSINSAFSLYKDHSDLK